MQRENYNTVFDMRNEGSAGLKDPPTHRPTRKRTKLKHASGILHMRFKDWKCPRHTDHKHIEGQTKTRLADELGSQSIRVFLLDGIRVDFVTTSSNRLKKNSTWKKTPNKRVQYARTMLFSQSWSQEEDWRFRRKKRRPSERSIFRQNIWNVRIAMTTSAIIPADTNILWLRT